MATTKQVVQPDVGSSLALKLQTRTAKVGIVGLGYVGLPLAVQFAKSGFSVTGIDVDGFKVGRLRQGKSCVKDVSSADLQEQIDSSHLRFTDRFEESAQLDTINICVPTPLRKTKDPDMSYIVAAVEAIKPHLHPGMLVILESTTFPGTTAELLAPALAETGLTVGEDLFLCFSPERVDPGNATYQTANIPKVVGGMTPSCCEFGALFYRQAIQTVVKVSSTEVAEMVKLLENTFRMINIGLVNELAIMCDRMKIDVWEVIDAAATKPFGYMPFYPGPGLGGHCIPIDPFYLSWKSKQAGVDSRFIDLAGQVNSSMPRFVVDKAQAALNERSKPVRGSKVHLMGVAYKRNISDVRESPAIDIMHLLRERGAILSYSDPFVPHLTTENCELHSNDEWAEADCVIIVADHDSFPWDEVVDTSALIVDARNALKGYSAAKIIRL